MRRAILSASALTLPLLLVSALGLYAAPNPNIADTDPRSPADEAKAFHLPPGFEIQLVAADPDINKPMNIDSTTAAGSGSARPSNIRSPPAPTASSNTRTPSKSSKTSAPTAGPQDHHLRRQARHPHRRTADAGPKPQDALIYSIPSIWRCATPGDGEADERTPLYSKYGFKDTHGMTGNFTWCFDGWVYAYHGYSNESTVKGADANGITMQSGNVYRIRADGSHLEYYTHGLVNPFGLCFDPLGNLFLPIAKPSRSSSFCAAAIIPASASPTTASVSAPT